MKGNFARRAMELGGWPVRSGIDLRLITAKGTTALPRVHRPYKCAVVVRGVVSRVNPEATPLDASPAPAGLWLSKTRLIQAMRKIDPDLAHMIESLAPVYLVKK
jgi:hypothetical protein